MSKHDFGEHAEEYSAKQKKKIPVWQSPKYIEARDKAVEMIDSGKYGLTDGDFWILMNETKSGKMGYTGLIISHNGCLKINDSLPDEKRFKPRCVELDKDGWGESLVYTYNCNEQGVYEVGEFSKLNGKNAYPYAMALKRMFDRVVLKTSRLAYSGVYSESESDDFSDKRDAPPASVKEKSDSEQKEAVPDSPTGDEEIVSEAVGKAPAICEECGETITATRNNTYDTIIRNGMHFNKHLCYSCLMKAFNAEKAAEAKKALTADAEAHSA